MTINSQEYKLLYDGQCIICRKLVADFVSPFLPLNIRAVSSQEFLFDNAQAPEEIAERAKGEILLYSPQGEVLGGIDAICKSIELSGHFLWVSKFLGLPIIKQLAEFKYKMFAWHRYTWFIIPPHLRCAECELKIPALWNALFFIVLALPMVVLTYLNFSVWYDSLSIITKPLFSTIKITNEIIAAVTTILTSVIFLFFNLLASYFFKKPLGINKIEPLKQAMVTNFFVTLISYPLVLLAKLNAYRLAEVFNEPILNSEFTFVSVVLISLLAFTQTQTFGRWLKVGYNPWWSALILSLDGILRGVTVVGVLAFV
jgi:predicted DCC family thiol-disulfide oxidoreductase YuxK